MVRLAGKNIHFWNRTIQFITLDPTGKHKLLRMFINLGKKLLKEAKKLTGVKSTSEVIRLALLDRISAEAQNRLAALGGYDPNFGRVKPDADSEC